MLQSLSTKSCRTKASTIKLRRLATELTAIVGITIAVLLAMLPTRHTEASRSIPLSGTAILDSTENGHYTQSLAGTVYTAVALDNTYEKMLLGFEPLSLTQTYSLTLGGAVQGAAIGPDGYYNVALDLGPGPTGQRRELWMYNLSTKQVVTTTTLPGMAYTVEYAPLPLRQVFQVYLPVVIKQ